MEVSFILIIIGKTASGKNAIVNKLVSEYGYKQIITYTTRPIRKKEKQDVTYHFISEEDFLQKINNDFFAEWKVYQTIEGKWYYGTSINELNNMNNKTVIILTPDGYRDIVEKLPNSTKAIYIYANNSTIKKRLLKRGDEKEEAQRRLEHDNMDFKGIENEVDKIFYNNCENDIDDVTQKIAQWVERNNV